IAKRSIPMNPRHINYLAVRRLLASLTVCFLISSVATGDPWCTDNNGASPWVCVNKSGVPPEPLTDFVFAFTDPANPDVTFITGNDGWEVWSQVSETVATPANLGHVKIDPSQPAYNFSVSIAHDTGVEILPGAISVKSIVLDDTDPSWTGYSSITSGHISGSLEGDPTPANLGHVKIDPSQPAHNLLVGVK
ncbi:MAG: hypothetical protein KJ749_14355, partial [Planctomycetes bacterium]|nr:hypothetical protein [Planctomycetota bacterium]